MSYGAMGNDAVFMQAETFGVGLLPLDDVFQVILPTGVSNEGPRSRVLVPLPAVS